jgi:nicotinate-nucleotide pyrophosphorylase (carboxylating)
MYAEGVIFEDEEVSVIFQIREWDDVITRALDEDRGNGDVTTRATISEETNCSGRFLAKESGVICGLPVLVRTYALIDERIQVDCRVADGDTVLAGSVIAQISGPARGILTGERVALNFIRHLSGIATRTRAAVQAVQGTRTRITDTRKTTPGLRSLEKYAVRMGGGVNHRFNLADGILIKDNHIRAAGGIRQAVERARQAAPHMLKIEVETETAGQIDEALQAGADIIMLDNMSLDEMALAVKQIGGRAVVEASGNMGDKDLKAVAATGVDLISIGALTHSVQALDISLRFDL